MFSFESIYSFVSFLASFAIILILLGISHKPKGTPPPDDTDKPDSQ